MLIDAPAIRCMSSGSSQIYDGLLERNGGTWINELYDDMEWMAIAWVRAIRQPATKGRKTRGALELWEDIQTGWN